MVEVVIHPQGMYPIDAHPLQEWRDGLDWLVDIERRVLDYAMEWADGSQMEVETYACADALFVTPIDVIEACFSMAAKGYLGATLHKSDHGVSFLRLVATERGQ